MSDQVSSSLRIVEERRDFTPGDSDSLTHVRLECPQIGQRRSLFACMACPRFVDWVLADDGRAVVICRKGWSS